jgi:hypothetical protein
VPGAPEGHESAPPPAATTLEPEEIHEELVALALPAPASPRPPSGTEAGRADAEAARPAEVGRDVAPGAEGEAPARKRVR